MSNADGAPRYETVITYARDTLKAAMLINGGAAVAILAFIGNIWSSNSSCEVTMLLPWALVTFSLGVLLAGIAYALSYFTELSYYSTEVIHQFIKQISIDKNDEIVKKFVDKRVDRGRYFHVAGVCAALSSFLCFAIGCSLAFLALVC